MAADTDRVRRAQTALARGPGVASELELEGVGLERCQLADAPGSAEWDRRLGLRLEPARSRRFPRRPAADNPADRGGIGASARRYVAVRDPLAATGERPGDCLQPTGEACLTYAYALYDLGHALRLDGRPRAAIPILRRRLRIDNQREAVQAELEVAEAQIG